MSCHTYVTIHFAETKVSAGFIDILNETFIGHGLTPLDQIFVTPIDAAGAREAKWSEIIAILPGLKHFLVVFRNDLFFVHVLIGISNHSTCNRILVEASLEQRIAYTAEEKTAVLTLQDLTLQLREKLNAIDSCATNENGDTWFRFSKEEWKPLGELPICDD